MWQAIIYRAAVKLAPMYRPGFCHPDLAFALRERAYHNMANEHCCVGILKELQHSKQAMLEEVHFNPSARLAILGPRGNQRTQIECP